MGEHLTDEEREAAAWLRRVLDQGGLGGTLTEDDRLRKILDAVDRLERATADAEARLAAVSEAVEPVDPPMGTRDALASRDGAFVVQRVLAALDSAPTTDADGRDERRDGAGGSRWERG